MKAVVAQAFGPPESLAIETLPQPKPGPGELRVAVHFAGISFADVLIAAGEYQLKPPLPFTPGSEYAGVVIETGPGVTGFAPGDRVRAGSFGGAFAEEAIVAAASAAKVTPGQPLAEAALIRSSYMTACYALKWRGQVKAGETVVVLGAGGAVGIAAVQAAKAYGARVIASASSEAKRQLALDNGADHALDSTAQDWRDRLKAAAGGRGVDVVLDTVGGAQTERAFRSLAWNGRLLVVGFAGGGIPKLPTNLALLKGASLVGVDIRQVAIHEPEVSQAVADEVTRLVEAGIARPPIAQVYALEDFAEAMIATRAGQSAGRILLRMPAAG